MKTIADSTTEFAPAFALTQVVSRLTLSRLRRTSFACFMACVAVGIIFLLIGLETYRFLVLGLGLLFFSLWLEQIALFGYHNHYYFKGLRSIIGLEDNTEATVTYEVAEIAMTNAHDATAAFCHSKFGILVLLRSGIQSEAITDFLAGDRTRISTDTILLPPHKSYTMIDLGLHLLKQDLAFAAFLQTAGVLPETYIASLKWVIGSYHHDKQLTRWWSKDNLSRQTPIGREWTYGTAYLLEKFSRSITTSAIFSTLTTDATFAAEKITEIETALQRGQSANVLIIGEAGVGAMDLVIEIDRRIKAGRALGAVASQHIVVLDTNRLLAAHSSKEELELTIMSLLNDAINAGDIIIVIENISSFIREAQSKGVFIPEIFDEYLASPYLHIIAIDTPGGFHTYLEPIGGFTRRFAEVLISEPDLGATTRLLQSIAIHQERRFPILFTYAGLHAISTSADRYIVEGVMPDKAIELLQEVVVKAGSAGEAFITEDFVYGVVSIKTGIPAGPVAESERDLLLHLEEKLHAKVIGQEPALAAIARTMRRARAGIQSSDKPIGSFLFLGPTGVGKTETAKALAATFFGSEQKMQRLDMSEFSGSDALVRLLGTGEHSGILPDMLREQPYGVLLLDEFEKAATAVHDLFLQILDEGIFTDGRGTKVNARNAIIIATSNAGSALIIKTVQQREALAHLTQEIINAIISQKTFRPELINRFDSTIIFEPLKETEQLQVADLQLHSLYERIKSRGYTLTLDRELIATLARLGYDPQFGARPMQRVIQDLVEEKVAQQIISGAAKKGTPIHLSISDFSKDELSQRF
jgi:ATP-dependent Clp protease ATP-binding subunit ClpA